MKSVFVALLGVLAGIYLLNPTAGVIEILSDFIPFIGNLDEAAAMALLISVLGYFGIDVSGFFKKDKKSEAVEEDKK